MSDPSPSAKVPQHPPRAYLGWGLFATVACFLPLGLIALYFGLRTSRAIAEDRLDDAIHGSHVTRRWLVATIVVGLVIYAVITIVFILLGAFSP
jgi:hypothetical protein